MGVAMTDQLKVERPRRARRNRKFKWFEVVGLPVLGAALIAMVQVLFPEILEKMKRYVLGSTFGPYVMLRANDTNTSDSAVVTNLTLTEYNGLLSGELHIPPDGTSNIPPAGGRRVYSGFLGGDGFLVLTYKSDSPLHGIGEYFFAENDNGDYTGYARVNICTNRGQIIKQCNAILTKNQGGAMKKYERTLKQQCQLVEFPAPDDNSKVAEKEPCPESFQTGQR